MEDALKLAEGFDPGMPIRKARKCVQDVVDMATNQMPGDHRDGRYYVGDKEGPKTQLNKLGLGWSVMLAFNNWALDLVRQTRNFNAANTGGWQTSVFNKKDVLTGRDEAGAGGTAWTDSTAAVGGAGKPLFQHGDWLSAATLVKRVWHLAHLGKVPRNLATTSQTFPTTTTRTPWSLGLAEWPGGPLDRR